MVTPVANTITSTTSATQDLEVFTNYPSEKNNKLLQQKYGSQNAFFQKVQEEGYKEGFESVPKPSFDPNLPMTEIGDGTYQKYMGQFLPPETTGGAGSSGIIPQEQAQTWNQKLNVPDFLAAGKASQALYNQGALPDVKMTTDTAVDQPSPVPKGDVRQFIESIEQKILTEDDPWTIIPMLKNIRKIKQNIKGGITTVKEAVEPTVNELKDEALKIEGKYQTSLVEKIMPTINKWAQGIQKWGGEMKEKVSSADIFDIDVSGATADYKERVAKQNERLEAVGLDPVKFPLNLDISYKKFKWKDDKVGGEKIPLQEPVHKKAADLLKREKLMMEAGKAGADPQEALEKYISRKKEFDIAEEEKAKEGWYGEDKIFGIDLEKLLKKDKKAVEKKETKDVIQEVTETIPTEKKGGIKELDTSGRGGTVEDQLEMSRMHVDHLLENLPEGAIPQLTNEMEGMGIKTKGLTDKDLLLIAMGLGMMASDKPGLQGAGSGALEGLKLVAPLMKEKSSDIQMITVKNDEGENVIVRYNKKKGTYEETGLKSGTTSKNTTLEKIKTLSTLANVDQDVVATAMITSLTQSKGKSRVDRIEDMMDTLNRNLGGMVLKPDKLRDLAEKIVDENMASNLKVTESDLNLP